MSFLCFEFVGQHLSVRVYSDHSGAHMIILGLIAAFKHVNVLLGFV